MKCQRTGHENTTNNTSKTGKIRAKDNETKVGKKYNICISRSIVLAPSPPTFRGGDRLTLRAGDTFQSELWVLLGDSPLADEVLPFLDASALALALALMASTSCRRLRSSGLSDTGTVLVPPYSTGRTCTGSGGGGGRSGKRKGDGVVLPYNPFDSAQSFFRCKKSRGCMWHNSIILARVLLRGAIVNRTYGIHKKTYI